MDERTARRPPATAAAAAATAAPAAAARAPPSPLALRASKAMATQRVSHSASSLSARSALPMSPPARSRYALASSAVAGWPRRAVAADARRCTSKRRSGAWRRAPSVSQGAHGATQPCTRGRHEARTGPGGGGSAVGTLMTLRELKDSGLSIELAVIIACARRSARARGQRRSAPRVGCDAALTGVIIGVARTSGVVL